jgi:hypothetical protein
MLPGRTLKTFQTLGGISLTSALAICNIAGVRLGEGEGGVRDGEGRGWRCGAAGVMSAGGATALR